MRYKWPERQSNCHLLLVSLALQVFLIWIVSSSNAESAPGPESNTDGGQKIFWNSMELRGHLSTRYVFRSAHSYGGDYSDNDFFEYLRLDVSVPQDRKYELHFFGIARQDIDGDNDRHDFYPLEDIGNARDESYTGSLYDAHVAINRPFSHISQVRLGRQAGTRDEPVFFDGISVDTVISKKRICFTAYGGSAVHFEELDYEWGDDTLAGAGIDFSPTFNSVISLDYLYVQDKRDFFGFEDREDQLFSLKVWHRFARFLSAMTRFRYLNDEARDIKVGAAGTFPDEGFEISAGYFRQLSEESEHSNELSNYYDVVGTTSEFQSFDVKLRKFFGEHYGVDIGYYDHRLIDDADEDSFNRDYSRVYAALDIADLVLKGLTISVIGEYWETEGNDYRTGGLDASYIYKKRGRKGELSAGTYYSLYKYDYYDERGQQDDIQTYYARSIIPLGRHFSADGKYEYEDGSDDFQSFTFGVRYDF